MKTTDDYILVDRSILALHMAEQEFKLKFEDRYPFLELYEQVDEKGDWYLKPEYNSIYQAIEKRWREDLLDYDIMQSVEL